MSYRWFLKSSVDSVVMGRFFIAGRQRSAEKDSRCMYVDGKPADLEYGLGGNLHGKN